MSNKKADKDYVYETAESSYYQLLQQYAKENRLIMTEAENALWQLLKGKAMGYKFRRQHVVGEFIADFINLHYKLIVEVDGKYHFYHDQLISDHDRTAQLNQMGYTVVRFTNEEVLGDIDNVGKQIKAIIKRMEVSYPTNNTTQHSTNSAASQPATPPSPFGEGRGGAAGGGCPSPSGKGWGEAVSLNAWAVDAACSGNPGPMEYQGIDLKTGQQVFHFGPVEGTNNIGEFLAIVHALALMEQRGIKDKTIYSDSVNAMLWVRKKQCKTKLERNEKTARVYELIARAESWLKTHPVSVPIVKWETKQWGEVPADFGRKK